MKRASVHSLAVPAQDVAVSSSTDKQSSATDIEDIPNPSDPAAPSREVSSRRQKLSDIFTIFCAGFALISDGYQNNLMYVDELY